MKFSDNLRQLRKEKDYSQEYLAEKLGVTRQTISKWENATAMPDLKKLTEVAELFNIGINELLGFSEEKGEPVNNVEIEATYAYQKQEAELARLTADIKSIRRKSTVSIITVIVLSVALIISILNIANLKNQWDSINETLRELRDIQNGSTFITDNTNQTYNDLNYEVIGFSKEHKDNLILKLEYSPEKISKNAKVSVQYIIDGQKKKVDFENEDNNYVVQIEYPVNADNYFIIFTDNGEEITKEDFWLDIRENMFVVDSSPVSVETTTTDSGVSTIKFDDFFSFNSSSLIKIKSAKFILKDDTGKNIYSQNVNLQSSVSFDRNCYVVEQDNFIDNVNGEICDALYELYDDNGNTYIYYILCNSLNSYEDEIVMK